jgi:predicted phage-related endonuclease
LVLKKCRENAINELKRDFLGDSKSLKEYASKLKQEMKGQSKQMIAKYEVQVNDHLT